MKKKIENTIKFLKERLPDEIDIGIILGTGLGTLVNHMSQKISIQYDEIPGFPSATIEFHKGELIYGELYGRKVLAFQGRFHLYEGHSYFEITYPIRILNALGGEKILISNAAGGINLDFKKADLMLIKDHINLQGGSPLAFKEVEHFGERFVDMNQPYNADLIEKSISVAKKLDITLHQGVYASVIGPQLETAAEYRFLKIIGSDAVGMSTVPEVIVARHLNMEVLAISIITDLCDPDNLEPVNIQDIITHAKLGEEKLIQLCRELIPII